MDEQLIGILPGDLRGIKNIKFYNLYITNQRIVGGKTGSGQLTRSYSKNTFLAHYTFGATLGDKLIGANKKTATEIRSEDDSKYKGMSFEEILNEDDNNFELTLNSIKAVKLKKFKNWRGGKHFFHMIIEADKKKTFICDAVFYNSLNNLLNEILPDKISVKDGALF